MNNNNAKFNALESDGDAFSQVLQLLKLDVAIYHNAKVCGNWRIDEHNIGATCFHIVTEGRCSLDVPGYFNGVLGCGDLVIFPHELTHYMQPIAALSSSILITMQQPQLRVLDYCAAKCVSSTKVIATC